MNALGALVGTNLAFFGGSGKEIDLRQRVSCTIFSFFIDTPGEELNVNFMSPDYFIGPAYRRIDNSCVYVSEKRVPFPTRGG